MADASPQPARVTIRDVAAAADVHVSTVSRALDANKSSMIAEATRERVIAAARELGYRPHLVASGLRRGQTLTVGIVVPDLGNPIYAPFARGATHALEGGAYMPLLADTQGDRERLARIVDHLAGRRVEAIITTAARLSDEELLVQLDERGIPVVLAIRTIISSGLTAVVHDDEQGGRLAAEHLVSLGHRRLAQIQGPLDVEPFVRRSTGFQEAAGEAGAALAACPDRPHVDTGLTPERGRLMTDILLDAPERERPTAIFVQNDVMGLGALEAIRHRGLRCPDDISVVSYNDAFFAAHTDPPLTTVDLDAYGIGHLAGELALARIDAPHGRGDTAVSPPHLVVRRSTAPPARRR